jgi:hypothetical protein
MEKIKKLESKWMAAKWMTAKWQGPKMIRESSQE